MKKTVGTPQAAKLIGVSTATIHRWLRDERVRPQGIPLGDGRMLWRWTDADIAKGRKLKATLKPGPKPKGTP